MAEKLRAYEPKIEIEYRSRICLKCNELKSIQVPKRICQECTELNEKSRLGKTARREGGGAYRRGKDVN